MFILYSTPLVMSSGKNCNQNIFCYLSKKKELSVIAMAKEINDVESQESKNEWHKICSNILWGFYTWNNFGFEGLWTLTKLEKKMVDSFWRKKNKQKRWKGMVCR